MTTNPYFAQMTQEWNAQGYVPDDMNLWMMLCGYLDLQDGVTFIALLPKVLYPLLLDMPRANAVRQWFGERQVLPVVERAGGLVALLPDWRVRLERMRHLAWESQASVDCTIFGYVPWFWQLDFCQDDELGGVDDAS